MLKVLNRSRSALRRFSNKFTKEDYVKQSFSPKWPESSEKLTSVDRLFSLKPAILREQEEDEELDGLLDEFENLEDYDYDKSTFRLGREILKISRVAYRHEEQLSLDFKKKKEEIVSFRTPSQIRRCLNDWMLKYDRDVMFEFRKKKIGWNINASEDMDNESKSPIVYGPEDVVAYAHYFLPSRYGICKRILREISNILPTYTPKRILDFGCGPATAGVAAADTFASLSPNEVDTARKYVGIDNSRSMLDAAKIMMRDRGLNSVFWGKTSDVVDRAVHQGDRYDLAIASFTLSELTSDKNRLAATQLLFDMLDIGGLLFIVEAGNPEGSHTVRSARQFILDLYPKEQQVKGQKKKGGAVVPLPEGYDEKDIYATVVSPCTHDKECPLGDGVWCSFAQKVHSGMIRKENLEKFSYVVIQKVSRKKIDLSKVDEWVRPASRLKGSTVQTPVEILQTFVDTAPKEINGLVESLTESINWSEYKPLLYRDEYARILRSPLKNKGHVTMDLCTSSGNVRRHTLSKNCLLDVPSLYSALRKSSWGGLHPVVKEINSNDEISPLCKVRSGDDEYDGGDSDSFNEHLLSAAKRFTKNKNSLNRNSPFASSNLPNTDKLGTMRSIEKVKPVEVQPTHIMPQKGDDDPIISPEQVDALNKLLNSGDPERILKRRKKRVEGSSGATSIDDLIEQMRLEEMRDEDPENLIPTSKAGRKGIRRRVK